ncbi:hypothetical protein [Actinacidiphila yanglinensis]|uniref:hypothetical protein n=1 Tax=Actinacidiphila yanglinensis TaxID=310779 RepID=UPI000CDE8BB5|nr:hypothetical protein [Actinacidiphila yanglinensis]
MRDRFGGVLVASTGALCVEAVVGGIAALAWQGTRENPGLAYSGLGFFVLIMLVPVLTVLLMLLSAGVVMPLLAAAGWLGRRGRGRAQWWWTPTLAAAAEAPLAVLVAVLAGSVVTLVQVVVGWLVGTAALAGPALVSRRLLLSHRPRLSGRAILGRVTAYGALAVVAAVVAAIGLSAVLGYVPPRLSTQLVAGKWTDGKGGTLVLTPDGEGTATGLRTYDFDAIHRCTGTGTWVYGSGTDAWSQEVSVSVAGCDTQTWRVLGTTEHPKLYVFIGDPDSEDLYVLRRRA